MSSGRKQIILAFFLFFILALPATFAPTLPAIISGTAKLSGSVAPVGTEIMARISGIDRGSATVSSAGTYRILVTAADPYEYGKAINFFLKSPAMSGYVEAFESIAYADGLLELNLTTPIDTNWPLLSGAVYPSSLVYVNSGDVDILSAGTCTDSQLNDYGMHATEPYRVYYAGVSQGANCADVTYTTPAGPWNTSSSAYFEGTNGSYYCIVLFCQDAVGNQLAFTSTGKILYDISAPSTTIAVGTPNYDTSPVYVTSSTLFTLSAVDNAAGVASTEYDIDSGGGTTYSGPFGLSGYDEGEHTIEYYSTDNAGNVESAGTLDVYVDNTAPETTDDAPGGWQSGGILLELNATDGESNIDYTTYSVDGDEWEEGTVAEISDDGNHTVEYYSVDNVGNVEETKTAYVAIDGTPPSVNAGLDKTADAIFSQNATANDSLSGIASFAWTNVSGPGAITFETPNSEDTLILASTGGTYVIRLNVTDRAGNSAYDEMTLVWDSTPPVVTSNSPVDNYNSPSSTVSFAFTATDNLASSMNCSLKINGTVSATNSSVANKTATTFTVFGLSEGTTVWNITCADNAGNANESAARTLTVDTVPPATTDNYTTNDNIWQNSSQTISLYPSDPSPSSGIAYTRYCIGATCTPSIDYTIPVTISSENITYFRYASADNFGNAQPPVLRTVKIDTTAPSVSIYSPANASWQNGTISVAYNATDALSGASSCQWAWRDNANITWWSAYTNTSCGTLSSFSFNTALCDDDSAADCDIRLSATDSAGNSNAAVIALKVDNSPPVISTVILTPSVIRDGTYVNITADGRDVHSGIKSCWAFKYYTNGTQINAVSGGLSNNCFGNRNISFGLGDGTYVIAVRARNNVDMESWANATIIIDDTPPSAAIASPASGTATSDTTPEITFTLTDNFASSMAYVLYAGGVSVAAGNANNSTSTGVNTTVLAEGSHMIKVQATDGAGNSINSTEIPLLIDATAPVVSISSPANGSIINYVPNISGTVADANLAWIRTDSSYYSGFDNTTPFNFTNTSALPQGTYTINVSANDSAGNSGWATITFTYDATPPAISVQSPLNAYYPQNWVWANLTMSEAGSWCGASLNNTANQTLANSTGKWWANISANEGSNTLKLYCNDSAGNVGSTPAMYFTVDTIAPVVSITQPLSSGIWYNTAPSITASCTDTNFANMTINHTSYTATNTSTPATWTNISTVPQGENSFRITCTDSVGRTGTADRSFNFDSVKPTINILSPTNTTYAATSIWFNVTISETANWTGYSLDGGANVTVANSSGNWNAQNSSMSQGIHNVRFYANDSAGNMNQSQKIYFTVDSIAPYVQIVLPENVTYNSTSRTLNFTATDATSGISTTWYNYNGINTTITGNVSFTALNNQQSVLALFANDTAGNVNSTSVTFTVDTMAPSILAVFPANLSTVNTALPVIGASYNDTLSGTNASSAVLYVDGTEVAASANSTAITYAPPTNLSEGLHNASVSVSDYAGNSNTAVWQFTVQSVHNIRVNSVSAPATSPSSVAINVTANISNTGSFNETPTIRLRANGAEVASSTTSISSGETKTVNLTWTPSADGTYTLAVLSDALSGESNTSDNSASTSIVISTTHDISVDSITYNKSGSGNTVYLYDSINVSANVTNRGNVNETVSFVLKEDASALSSQSVSLAPNQTKEISFLWTPGTAVYKTVSVESLAVSGETDFSNNIKSVPNIRVWSVVENMQLYWANSANYPRTSPNYSVGDPFYVWGKVKNLAPTDVTFYSVPLKINTAGLPINWVSTGGTSDTYAFNLAGGSILTSQYWQLNSTASGAYNITLMLGNPGDSLVINRVVQIS